MDVSKFVPHSSCWRTDIPGVSSLGLSWIRLLQTILSNSLSGGGSPNHWGKYIQVKWLNVRCRDHILRNCHTFFPKCLPRFTLFSMPCESSHCLKSLPTFGVSRVFHFNFKYLVLGSICISHQQLSCVFFEALTHGPLTHLFFLINSLKILI